MKSPNAIDTGITGQPSAQVLKIDTNHHDRLVNVHADDPGLESGRWASEWVLVGQLLLLKWP